MSFIPYHKENVDESITNTIVDNTHILARPTAFCFIRYIIPEIDIKFLVL